MSYSPTASAPPSPSSIPLADLSRVRSSSNLADVDNSCSARMKRCFSEAIKATKTSCIATLYGRCFPFFPLISGVWNFTTSTINAQIFNMLINLFWRPVVTGDEWKQFEFLVKAVRCAKIVAISAIPFALYNIVIESGNLVNHGSKVDAALRLTESLGWIGDYSSTFIQGLHALGAVGEGALTASFALSVVGTCFAASTLVLNAKHLRYGEQLLKRMHGGEQAADSLRWISRRSPEALFWHFGMEADQLKKILLANRTPESAETTLEALKGRVQSKNLSCKLTISSSSIYLVGMAILLFTPFFPIAYGLLATAAILSVIKFICEWKASNRFEIAMAKALLDSSPQSH